MTKRLKLLVFITVISLVVLGISLAPINTGMIHAVTPTPTPPPTGYVLTISAKSLTSVSITGKGATVNVNPPGITLNCDQQPQVTCLNGSQVVVTANNPVTLPGMIYDVSTFVRWEGDVTSTANPLTITMDGPKNLVACYNVVHYNLNTPTPTLVKTPTPVPTATPGWVPYIPTVDQVAIKPDLAQRSVVVELTFPNSGYRVADPGSVAIAAGINPDGTTSMSFITVGTKIERYTGGSVQVITTKTITYSNLGFGTKNTFAFYVYNTLVKQIQFAGAITGTPTPTLTVTPSPTPVVTATPASTPKNSLKIQFYNQSTAATSNQIYTNIKLINTSTSAIVLTNVKIRYYYTIDGAKSQNFYCDYTPLGSGNVTGTFVTMATAKTGADTYLEIGFTSGAGSLAAGANVTVQGRIAKSDWSNYTQTNDYSFNSTATTFVDWSKVTGYVSGALQWGTEP